MPSLETADRPLALLVFAEAALVLPALTIVWWFRLPLDEQFPSGWPLALAVVRGVAATGPMVAALWLLLRTQYPPLVRFREQVETMLGELIGRAGIGWLVAVSATAGVGEELLFRGALQPLLGQWLLALLGNFAAWGGVAAASLLFGLAHPISRLYVVLAAVIGFYLGAITLCSGEIVSAMVAHGLYDLIALQWLLSRREQH